MVKELSVRAFARRTGVSHVAVLKAIRIGRLKQSIRRRDGTPVIVDVACADREWRDNASRTPPATPKTRKKPPAEPTSGPTLTEATRQVTMERQRKLAMENAVASGQLVAKTAVVKEAFEAERIIREAILNLPARIAGELAAESDANRVSAKLDAALREALTAASDALLATVNE